LLAALGATRVRLQKTRVAEQQEGFDEARLLRSIAAAILRGLARELAEAEGEEEYTGKTGDKDLGADDVDALRGRNVTTRRSHGILSLLAERKRVETGYGLKEQPMDGAGEEKGE
jgi:hypothetical protein